MESLAITGFKFLAGTSTNLALLVGAVVLIYLAFFYSNKSNSENTEKISKTQQEQINSLLEQVKFLSEELVKARVQLTEIHELNVQLMGKVRDSSIRIQDLEDTIKRFGGNSSNRAPA